jgi:hypothetical protein
MPANSFFSIRNKKKSTGARSGRVGNLLDGFLLQVRLHQLCGMDQHIVPVQEPLPGDQVGPSLPESLHKSPQSSDVFSIGGHVPGT